MRVDCVLPHCAGSHGSSVHSLFSAVPGAWRRSEDALKK